jgi:hypothetical protein
VLIRVAGSEYFIASDWNNRPVSAPNWVTNYTVPEGKMLVVDAVVFFDDGGEGDDRLPLIVHGEVFELDFDDGKMNWCALVDCDSGRAGK